MTGFSSADFCKLTLQEVLDFMLDEDASKVMLAGFVDDKRCNVSIKMEVKE